MNRNNINEGGYGVLWSSHYGKSNDFLDNENNGKLLGCNPDEVGQCYQALFDDFNNIYKDGYLDASAYQSIQQMLYMGMQQAQQTLANGGVNGLSINGGQGGQGGMTGGQGGTASGSNTQQIIELLTNIKYLANTMYEGGKLSADAKLSIDGACDNSIVSAYISQAQQGNMNNGMNMMNGMSNGYTMNGMSNGYTMNGMSNGYTMNGMSGMNGMNGMSMMNGMSGMNSGYGNNGMSSSQYFQTGSQNA